MSAPIETWRELCDRLHDRDSAPAAQASARLLLSCKAEWEGLVIARPAVHCSWR